MFTLQVLGLGALRNAISPLLTLSNYADFKCSPKSMSLTVSRAADIYSFTSVLRIFDRFFTIFSFCPDVHADADADYNLEIQVADFFRHIPNEDSYLTVLIPRGCTSLNLISATRLGGFQSLTSLMATPSKNEEVADSTRNGSLQLMQKSSERSLQNYLKTVVIQFLGLHLLHKLCFLHFEEIGIGIGMDIGTEGENGEKPIENSED